MSTGSMDAILRALNERAKELNTLYRVEEILRSPERPLHDLLYSVVQALPAGWQLETSAGVGLANTSARLQRLFGADYEIVIQNRAPAGVEARLSIPLRLAAAEADSQTS